MTIPRAIWRVGLMVASALFVDHFWHDRALAVAEIVALALGLALADHVKGKLKDP